IHKGKNCVPRTLERTERADLSKVAQRPVVAAEQEMIAVVDAAAKFRIHIRKGAPAGIASGLIQPHVSTLAAKLDRSRETSETGADDMHRARPDSHTKPCRN